MNKFLILLLTSMISTSLFASAFTDTYIVGSGSTYFMKSKEGADANVSIYTASKEGDSLSIEYFIESVNTFIPSKLWQQFTLEKSSAGPLKVTKGYIFKDGGDHPETMGPEHVKGKDGVKTTDFLFSTFEQINKHLKNKEKVSVPAGTIETSRYQITSNGQTIDFWIAENQSPLTLVKLISKGSIAAQNYELQLLTLVKNVAAKIDPSKAKPLSKEMTTLLEKSLK
ncbi:MAG: hypothetical protein HN576_09715 [Bacteriovoracaceae bacterium]|jgi:hypothetical protein|nr:hypothetical protein [Bacteriovoracaceae bacterium]